MGEGMNKFLNILGFGNDSDDDEYDEEYDEMEEKEENSSIKDDFFMRKKSKVKEIAFTLAAAAAVFALLVNLIPNLAYASSKIPVLGEIVKVVTFGRYEVKNDSYEANVVTPKIEGLLNKELEDKLNSEFKENSDAVIAAFEKDIKELEHQQPVLFMESMI